MAVAWYICTYKRRLGTPRPTRYCEMDDFTAQIFADGGDWSESEVLGNYALVKVRASQATLDAIAAAPGIIRIPLARLDVQLSALTSQQRTVLRNRLEAMGYTVEEITGALGNNLGQRTLGDLLRFAASRRLKPRYDADQDVIVCDGPVQVCRPVGDVDTAVGES